MKCPYTHPVNVRKADGSEVTYNRKYSRSDYKDDKRLHHILDMLSLLMNTGEEYPNLMYLLSSLCYRIIKVTIKIRRV